ncbi:MAG: hypothetical protein GY699_26370, partial [Desulfobacteraceae bacterium]|nr:hypothetical protein [Desulfobacteraceae bacterium]
MKSNIYKSVINIFFILMLLISGCLEKDNYTPEEKGDIAFKEKSYKKAILFWQKSIEKYPENSMLYAKAGKAYLKLSNIDKAEEFLGRSVKINPRQSDIQKELIRICLINGDNAKAKKKIQEVDDFLDKDANYYILHGDFHMISGDLKKAEDHYRKAISMHDNSLRAAIKLALCLKASGSDEEAESIIKDVEQKKLTRSFNLLLLSDYYFLLNKHAQAEKAILIAVKKHPDSQILNLRLVQFYLQAEMQEKALKILLKLEENNPDNVRFKLMLADLYLSDMQVSKAENMLEKLKGVLDEGSITDYNLLLAKCCLYKYQISYAVSYLKKVISKEPM